MIEINDHFPPNHILSLLKLFYLILFKNKANCAKKGNNCDKRQDFI